METMSQLENRSTLEWNTILNWFPLAYTISNRKRNMFHYYSISRNKQINQQIINAWTKMTSTVFNLSLSILAKSIKAKSLSKWGAQVSCNNCELWAFGMLKWNPYLYGLPLFLSIWAGIVLLSSSAGWIAILMPGYFHWDPHIQYWSDSGIDRVKMHGNSNCSWIPKTFDCKDNR